MTLSPQRRCEGRLTAATPPPHRRPAPLFSSARPGRPRGVGPPAIPRSASAFARSELPAPRILVPASTRRVGAGLVMRPPATSGQRLLAAWRRASRLAAGLPLGCCRFG